MKSTSSFAKHIDFVIIDIISLMFSFICSCLIRYKNIDYFISQYEEIIFVIIIINLLLVFFIEPYKDVLKRGYLVEVKKTLSFDILNLLICTLYLFVIKSSSDYSRIVVVLTYFLYFILSYLSRIIYKNIKLKKKTNTNKSSLLVICKSNNVNDVIKNTRDNYLISLCIIDGIIENRKIDGIKTIVNKSELLDFISKNWVDDIFIACPYSLIQKKLIDGIMIANIPIHIKLDEIEIFKKKTQIIDSIGGYATISCTKGIYSSWELFIKRVIDIIGGLIGSSITLILIVVIGPIIYLESPGSIFYVSKRVGKNGKIFKFYKFRSMVNNADELKKELAKNNRIKDGMMFKVENDPRIIPGIGNFIRKTSIDEFPQFFNVLKNDMSLVGTRPPTLDEWNKYTPYYRSRLSIKPGITGLWQVSGRSSITNFDDVVKLDNDYINNFSIGLDIKILFKTIYKLFVKDDKEAL